jgi:heme exporter protein B
VIFALIKKEIDLEIRRKSVVSGLLIYLVSCVFITYMAFGLRIISPLVWSALFWVIILFSAVNSIAKSFIGEKKGSEIYLYTITNPESIIISKILYNFLLCFILSLLGFVLFILFLSNPIENTLLFVTTLLLTSLGFSTSLTLLSAIASKANNSNILMAVLSFPVIISILLLSIKITKNCVDGLDPSVSYPELIMLTSINCLGVAVSYILFPYIWRS